MFRRMSLFLLTLLTGLIFFASNQVGTISVSAMGGGGDGWRAEYYNNTTWDGAPVLVRTEGSVNNWWGKEAPAPGVEADFFSVRWTAPLILSQARTIRFKTTADDTLRLLIDGELINEHPQAGATKTVEHTIAAGQHEIMIEYVEYVGDAYAIFEMQTVKDAPPASSNGAWAAQYFNNTTLAGQPNATDSTDRLFYDWANGAPKPGVPADNFSARWTRTDSIQSRMRYTFAATADDSVVVKVDGKVIMDTSSGQPWQTQIARVELAPGTHQFVVEFVEKTHYAYVDVEVDREVLSQTQSQPPTINHFTIDKTWAGPNDTVTLSWNIDDADTVSIRPENVPGVFSMDGLDAVGSMTFDMNRFCDNDGQVSFTLIARHFDWQEEARETRTVATPAYDWFFTLKDGSKPDRSPCFAARRTAAAQQRFERGWMLWSDDHDLIYVLYDADEYGNQLWQRFGDTFDETGGDANNDALTPPDGLEVPIRGFGALWHSNEEVRDKLGWAVAGERGFTSTYQSHLVVGKYNTSEWHFSNADDKLFSLFGYKVANGPNAHDIWTLGQFDWE